MEQTQAEAVQRPSATEVGPPLGIELRHLRYFVALADAGSFTHAAERIFIAQPTLSHQIRRLEEIIGTPLLQRRREGLRLTAAGSVLLDASRTVLSLVDQEVSRTRQAAGLGRQRLRVVMPLAADAPLPGFGAHTITVWATDEAGGGGPQAGPRAVTVNQAGGRAWPGSGRGLSRAAGRGVLPVRRSSMPCTSIQAPAIRLNRPNSSARVTAPMPAGSALDKSIIITDDRLHK